MRYPVTLQSVHSKLCRIRPSFLQKDPIYHCGGRSSKRVLNTSGQSWTNEGVSGEDEVLQDSAPTSDTITIGTINNPVTSTH